MKKQLLILVFLAFLGSWSKGWCIPYSWETLADFGVLTDLNLFLTKDFYYRNSDVEGKVAVGGDADLKSFSIAKKASPSKYSFIVGGNANLGDLGPAEGGQINNGGLWVGQNASLKRIGMPQGDIAAKGNVSLEQLTVEKGSVVAGGDIELKNAVVKKNAIAKGNISLTYSSVHGDIIPNRTDLLINEPLDFDNIDLLNISQNLLVDGIDIEKDNEGKIYIDLDTICQGNICYLDISDINFETSWGIYIKSNSHKTAIINIINSQQDKLTISHKDFKLLGNISSLNILYNFSNFEEIEIYHVGFLGSILAPQADITFYEGVLYGSIFAQSLSSEKYIRGGQINLPVPESKTFILLLLALLSLIFLIKLNEERHN